MFTEMCQFIIHDPDNLFGPVWEYQLSSAKSESICSPAVYLHVRQQDRRTLRFNSQRNTD